MHQPHKGFTFPLRKAIFQNGNYRHEFHHSDRPQCTSRLLADIYWSGKILYKSSDTGLGTPLAFSQYKGTPPKYLQALSQSAALPLYHRPNKPLQLHSQNPPLSGCQSIFQQLPFEDIFWIDVSAQRVNRSICSASRPCCVDILLADFLSSSVSGSFGNDLKFFPFFNSVIHYRSSVTIV